MQASGGAAAPAELYDPSKVKAALNAAGYLIPEEQELADAILEIVQNSGKFNDDNTGVWLGYTPASENEENAAIGVKCGSCVFFNAPNGCDIIASAVEDGGLCRLAILPDGAVTAGAGPCWDGYKQVGMKNKNGKMVPNCVPVDASITADADGYDGECPPATQDIPLNLKNRQNAIDNVGYGPLNPEEPSLEFWQEKADKWSVTIPEAKKSICGNCVFFDRREKTLDCIQSGLSSGGSGDESAWDSIDQAELGYCTALDFKCAASRTCSVWAVGGPITATSGSKAAPKKDQIKGSSKNSKGSASGSKKINFSKSVEASLKTKAEEHNEKADRKATLGMLKAVYRRGAGAFSSSHRPDQNRNSWAMARVNAFLYLMKSGKPRNPAYTTDYDLLPASHPKSTKSSNSIIASVTSEDVLTVTLKNEEEYLTKEHSLLALAEYSGLGYEIIPALRTSWLRAVKSGENPFERATILASALYESKDADLLPKEGTL